MIEDTHPGVCSQNYSCRKSVSQSYTIFTETVLVVFYNYVLTSVRCESSLNLMTFLRILQLSWIEGHSIDRLGVFLGAKVWDTFAIVILWIVHWSKLLSAQDLSRPIMRTLGLQFFFMSQARLLIFLNLFIYLLFSLISFHFLENTDRWLYILVITVTLCRFWQHRSFIVEPYYNWESGYF